MIPGELDGHPNLMVGELRAESQHGMVQLCRLTLCPPDLCLELLRVCREAPHYFLSVEGELPDEEAIKHWFAEEELPLGCTSEHQFIFSILLNSDIIGVAHLLAACRDPERATIGLQLLSERLQGRGLGKIVYKMLEDLMKQWAMTSCRLGVVANNTSGLAFWNSVGFVEIGELAPMEGFLDKTIFMEKHFS